MPGFPTWTPTAKLNFFCPVSLFSHPLIVFVAGDIWASPSLFWNYQPFRLSFHFADVEMPSIQPSV